ncbi:hypothetical protein GQ457_13G022220 [Hibiscus cannabinus]
MSIDTMLLLNTSKEFQNGFHVPILARRIDIQGEYRCPPLRTDTMYCEYRYPRPSTGTHSCRSAFNAGRKLLNGTIDVHIYQIS